MSDISKVNSNIQVLLRFVNKYRLLDKLVAKIIESEECTKVLFYDNYLDIVCLKMAVSKVKLNEILLSKMFKLINRY